MMTTHRRTTYLRRNDDANGACRSDEKATSSTHTFLFRRNVGLQESLECPLSPLLTSFQKHYLSISRQVFTSCTHALER